MGRKTKEEINKSKIQTIIKDRYNDKLQENIDKFCKNCALYTTKCKHNLIPVTLDGEDCFYYEYLKKG